MPKIDMPYLIKDSSGIIVKLYVQPRSSKNTICGPHEDYLKIKITAPPVDGVANKHCIKYLSKLFKISKSSMKILTGLTGRKKRILITVPSEEIDDFFKKIALIINNC